ncbi:MAG: homoserine O-succinyltransferase [Nannocystaceae bacterium]|nr:homoserine O-succinyltransferase [bacterium]
MPLVEHSSLPSFAVLRDEGDEILSDGEARQRSTPALHIGFLNMMPDAAFVVTERQFMHLVGSSKHDAQFYVHPFSVPGLDRGVATQRYIDTHYVPFDDLTLAGLDALIITGANVANPSLELEAFWEPLQRTIDWATQNVASVLCSCLATHAIVKSLYGIDRTPLPRKCWGVFGHRRVAAHPLLRGVADRFDVPQSRHNQISRAQLEARGLKVLVESEEAGVHVAVSPDERFVFFQGHPEYDANSLLKEYKREVHRHIDGTRPDYPPHPQRYFSPEAARLADAYANDVREALARGAAPPAFPEAELEAQLGNTWRDTAKIMFDNWLGLVLEATSATTHANTRKDTP